MFSVQQKRDISDAVQKILRATAHPELPTTGEVSFTLKVVGAESWSYAEIANNAAVGDPGLNPHNELMASLPEDEARGLIDKAKDLTPLPDPRNTPAEFYTEMLTNTLAKLQRDVSRLEDRDKIKDNLYSDHQLIIDKLQEELKGIHIDVHAHEVRLTQLENFLTPIIEDNTIQHHSDQLSNLMTAVRQLGTPLVDKEG